MKRVNDPLRERGGECGGVDAGRAAGADPPVREETEVRGGGGDEAGDNDDDAGPGVGAGMGEGWRAELMGEIVLGPASEVSCPGGRGGVRSPGGRAGIGGRGRLRFWEESRELSPS